MCCFFNDDNLDFSYLIPKMSKAQKWRGSLKQIKPPVEQRPDENN